jgi:hypothetical protein
MSQRNIYLSGLSGQGMPINTLHAELRFLEKTDAALIKKAVDFVAASADVFKLRLFQKDGDIFQDFSGGVKECVIDEAC